MRSITSKHLTARSSLRYTQGWFSILLAIGTIAVLLIIVTSLAIMYIRESKLSRFSYNEVIASTAAEWIFEYGMLKVRNHRDGFQDAISPVEPDGKILEASTPRSTWLKTEYRIIASSTDHEFNISDTEHLIVPLFISNEWLIPTGVESRIPTIHTGITNTTGLNITGIWTLPWSIIAMSGSQSIAITGTGDINSLTTGLIRIKSSQCYRKSDGTQISCTLLAPGDEEIVYSYDTVMRLADFLSDPNITDPYFIMYNGSSTWATIHITSTSSFTLPTLTLNATANIWDSSQIFQFTEDKWKYYDALKYGIYNNP